MSIKEIFCQDKAVRILQCALGADKVAHGYIFAGIDGVGRFKTAGEWARILLCESRIEEEMDSRLRGNDKGGGNVKGAGRFFDSCGSCKSCTAFESGSHPDFQHVYKELIRFTREGKDRKTPVDLPIDVIREFLIEKVSARPILSDSKVYVVSEAEKLNRSSQNALLKVLEEPPEYCFIILLCSRLEKLLPTTKSRCQVVRFGAIDLYRIVDRLKSLGTNEKEALYWAGFSQGSLGTAIKWAGLNPDDGSVYGFKRELVGRLARYDIADALEFAQWIWQQSKTIADTLADRQKATSKTDINRSVQKCLIQMIALAFSDSMKLNASVKEGFVNSDQPEQISRLAARFTCRQAARQVSNAYKSMRWIDSNVNDRLIFEELLLNCVNPDKMRVWD